MAEESILLILFGCILFLIFLLFLLNAVRIVKPWQRIVIERLGKFRRIKGPGLRILIPLLEKMIVVDVREVVLDVPEQTIITKDGILVKVDAKVYYEVAKDEAQRSIYNVADLKEALVELVQANLRNNFGEEKLEDLFAIREDINKKILESLESPSRDWGIKTKRVKIQNMDPVSEEVKKAMSLKMISEEKRQEMIIKGKGEARAIKDVYAAIKDQDPDFVIRSLQALEEMAKGEAATIFIDKKQTPAFVSGLIAALRTRIKKTSPEKPEEKEESEEK